MADGIELGKAYVQIVPSAQGITGSISSVLNGEAASAGDSAGQTVGENLAGSMKKALAASGVDKTISGALDASGVLKKNASGVQQVQESLSGAIAKAVMLTSAIQTAAAKVKDLASSFIRSGVQYNAQIETYRTALTNMLGDAEKASAMLDSIKQDAARTPFSTDALVEANQYLLSAGENAEYSQKTILALGDAIKATGGGDAELSRMAQNLQQVANVGKASAVDIKQFAFAGINIYQVLADYTGKSVQEVQNMTVTYDVLTQALQAAAEEGGRYYGSMETQSETLSGRITTLQDNAKQLAGELSTGLSSAYGTVVEKANEWVTSILSDDEKLQQLNTTVTVVTAAIAAGTSGFIAYRTAMAISGVISAVRNATEGMTIAQAALNAVLAANPVAIVDGSGCPCGRSGNGLCRKRGLPGGLEQRVEFHQGLVFLGGRLYPRQAECDHGRSQRRRKCDRRTWPPGKPCGRLQRCLSSDPTELRGQQDPAAAEGRRPCTAHLQRRYVVG